MTVTVQQARKLCTPNELVLVLDSTSKQIKNLDAKQLKSSVNRARLLRDKWRDKSEKLVRTDKKGEQLKLDLENARTDTKHQLFVETLDRFSKRLDSVDKTSSDSAIKKKGPTAKATHRAQRADVRVVLADAKDQINVSTSPPKKTATKVPSSPSASRKKSSTKRSGVAASEKTSKNRTSRTASGSGEKALKVSAKKKRSVSVITKPSDAGARAAAKSNKLAKSGVTAMRAHTSSKGKRNQGRRDSKR